MPPSRPMLGVGTAALDTSHQPHPGAPKGVVHKVSTARLVWAYIGIAVALGLSTWYGSIGPFQEWNWLIALLALLCVAGAIALVAEDSSLRLRCTAAGLGAAVVGSLILSVVSPPILYFMPWSYDSSSDPTLGLLMLALVAILVEPILLVPAAAWAIARRREPRTVGLVYVRVAGVAAVLAGLSVCFHIWLIAPLTVVASAALAWIAAWKSPRRAQDFAPRLRVPYSPTRQILAGYDQSGRPMFVTAPQSTNSLATASLVCSLLGLSIIGVILGHQSLKQIAQTGEGGRGMALAGVAIGYVAIGIVAMTGIVLAVVISINHYA